jgi:hypothetical protein
MLPGWAEKRKESDLEESLAKALDNDELQLRAGEGGWEMSIRTKVCKCLYLLDLRRKKLVRPMTALNLHSPICPFAILCQLRPRFCSFGLLALLGLLAPANNESNLTVSKSITTSSLLPVTSQVNGDFLPSKPPSDDTCHSISYPC